MDSCPDTPSPVCAYLEQPSLIDFPGHLATVVFTSGCNFRCGFCHNAAFLDRPQPGLAWNQLQHLLESFRAQWVDAVVVSGGEPTLHGERLVALVRFCRKLGLAVKLDTNGSCPEVLRQVLPMVEYVAMDVKCAPAEYPSFVGFSEPTRITESIDLLKDLAADYEFRTTILAAFHTPERMQALATAIAGAKRYVMQPFVPREGLPDPALEQTPRTSPDLMAELARQIEPYVQQVVIR
jgi:pyruvate formate lyase activating enzyme